MIRPAKITDGKQIVPLIMVIMHDMELPIISKYSHETITAILEKGYETEDYRYSYKRALVMEEKGEIVGVLFGYPEEDEAIIDDPLREIFPLYGVPADEPMFTGKEAVANEWYIDTLCVREDYRGKGVGSKLLEALPEFIREQGISKLGLNVDKVNPRARKLYQSKGFEDNGVCIISGHAYDHMQKEI